MSKFIDQLISPGLELLEFEGKGEIGQVEFAKLIIIMHILLL